MVYAVFLWVVKGVCPCLPTPISPTPEEAKHHIFLPKVGETGVGEMGVGKQVPIR